MLSNNTADRWFEQGNLALFGYAAARWEKRSTPPSRWRNRRRSREGICVAFVCQPLTPRSQDTEALETIQAPSEIKAINPTPANATWYSVVNQTSRGPADGPIARRSPSAPITPRRHAALPSASANFSDASIYVSRYPDRSGPHAR